MVAPWEPASVTGMPLGSRRKRALDCMFTSNSGVPWANVSVKVSPAAVAETIGGGPLTGIAGAGTQDADAGPDDVQVAPVAAVGGGAVTAAPASAAAGAGALTTGVAFSELLWEGGVAVCGVAHPLTRTMAMAGSRFRSGTTIVILDLLAPATPQ